MTWNTLPPHIRTIAETHCTQKELAALRLWHNGCGYRRIALILGISMSTARGRVHRALDRIGNILEQEANGHLAHPLREPHRQTAPRSRRAPAP